MNSRQELEGKLERLGETLPKFPSLVDSVLRQIECSSPTPVRRYKRRWIMGSAVGLAATLSLVVVAWLVPLDGTPPLTFAQVQAAVAKQQWLHVRYDTGQQWWISLDDGKSYHKSAGGRIKCHDNNLRRFYWPGSGCIVEDRFDLPGAKRPPWEPKTPLEAVGISMENIPEGNGAHKQQKQERYLERHTDTVENRQLVRFDFYVRDALNQHLLMRQVWVDPQTHLPVRVRERLQPGQRERSDQKYTTGWYDFPGQGPASIYALGVPRDLPIVRRPHQLTADVAEVIDAVNDAKRRFPTRYRVIVWSETASEIDVIYRHGVPAREHGYPDWRGVKIHQARYFNLDKTEAAYHLPMPATAQEVLAWTRTQVPVNLSISDGERSFIQSGPYPPPFEAKDPPELRVSWVRRGMYFNRSNWPTDYQWSLAERTGPLVVTAVPDGALQNLITLRSEVGNTRRDYYLDPAVDYICVKETWWEKRSQSWEKAREYVLSDFKRLPQVQWYAGKRCMKDYGDPRRGIGARDVTWNVHVRVLGNNEIPPDTFDGKKLLEAAKQEGATIETH